jgi:hypothetical protein
MQYATIKTISDFVTRLPSAALEVSFRVLGLVSGRYAVEAKRLCLLRIIATSEAEAERIETLIDALFDRMDVLDDAADEAEIDLYVLTATGKV